MDYSVTATEDLSTTETGPLSLSAESQHEHQVPQLHAILTNRQIAAAVIGNIYELQNIVCRFSNKNDYQENLVDDVGDNMPDEGGASVPALYMVLSTDELQAAFEKISADETHRFQGLPEQSSNSYEQGNSGGIRAKGLIFFIRRLGKFSSKFLVEIKSYDYDYLVWLVKILSNRISLLVSRELAYSLEWKQQPTIDSMQIKVSLEPLSNIPGRIAAIESSSPTETVHTIIKLNRLESNYLESTVPNNNNMSSMINNAVPISDTSQLPLCPKYHAQISTQKTISEQVTANEETKQQYFKLLRLTKREVTFLIGKKGVKIEKLRSQTRCDIKVIPANDVLADTTNALQETQYIRIVSDKQASFELCLHLIEQQSLVYRCNSRGI